MSDNKENKTNWKPTDKRFVAFLDILGFKDLVMRNTHDEIFQILSQISKSKKLIEEATTHKETSKLFGDGEVYVVSFSDSIVIFSKNDNVENFNYFLLATRWLFTGAFNKQIPIKGAMAHGEISLNMKEQIYFGQPIIDAYLLEEEVNYMGVVAHNSIDSYISKIEDDSVLKSIDRLLFEEKTPLKCGSLTHTNLNWFKIIKETNEKVNIQYIKSKIDLFKKTTSGAARKYIDNTLKIFEKIEGNL